MKLPVDQLSAMIEETIRQIRAGVCRTQGARITADTELEIAVELIAPDGLNAIERESIQTTTPRETVETSPAVVEVTTENPVESSSYEDPSESSQEETVESGTSFSTEERHPVTNTSEEDPLTDVTKSVSDDHRDATQGNSQGGVDKTVTDYELEEI